ncbi:hypothetical protein BU23DRAFT_556775 [Bimuria novae-zelandiae CBS 107.79]|uniref:Uncharacterized protein n=1 Tax=Bimuria novae-zelandiae CBS 107.79 TaxID=1447943 RepID=A0A6A5V3E4_9PLEO|nr:hypothetical protein BU23DRAFT_556775 [Bimuria novae-zelandiae CBS 107.79]
MLTLSKAVEIGAPGAYHAIVEDHPDGAEERPILIEEDGTQDDPITLGGDEAPAEARVDNTRALVRMPLHQRNQFMQLAPWKASPANFRYVIAPSRLREMAKRHTGGSRYAIVIGVVRRPTWDVEDTYPEYICIASLEGGKALTIRVKTYSVEGQTLEKWPGGGQSYMTLERIVERGYLFPPFCNQFNKDRLRAYLQKMAEIDGMPRVREMVLTIRSGD